MNEDRQPEPLGFGVERVVAGVAEHDAVDVAADLDAGEPVPLQPPELGRSERRILQRHHAEPGESRRRRGDHRRDRVIDPARHGQAVSRRKPVRQQLRHRRQRLQCDAVAIHVVETSGDVPRPRVDLAKRLVRDGHARLVRIVPVDAWPARIRGGRRIFGEVLRHDVRMHVDHVHQHDAGTRTTNPSSASHSLI